jgi:hypothetical protein
MAATGAERESAVQLGLAEALIIVRAFGKGQAPKPRQLLGIAIVFTALSLVEVMPDPWPNTASKFGWLIVLAIGMVTVAGTTKPDGTNVLSSVAAMANSGQSLFPTQTPQQKAAYLAQGPNAGQQLA